MHWLLVKNGYYGGQGVHCRVVRLKIWLLGQGRHDRVEGSKCNGRMHERHLKPSHVRFDGH